MQESAQPNGFSYVLGYYRGMRKFAGMIEKIADDRFGASLAPQTLGTRWETFKGRFARSPFGLAPAGVASGLTDAAGDVTGYVGRATTPVAQFFGGDRVGDAYESAMSDASSAMHNAAGYIRASSDFDDATVPGQPETYGKGTTPEAEGLGAMSTGFRVGGDLAAAYYGLRPGGRIAGVASKGGTVAGASDMVNNGAKGNWAGAAMSGVPLLFGLGSNKIMTGISDAMGYYGSAQNIAQGLKKSSAAPVAYPVYTVQRGDALERIARKHGTTAREIAKLNGIKNLNSILIGQKLRLPPAAPGPAVPAKPVVPAVSAPAPATTNAPTVSAPVLATTNAPAKPAWTPPPLPPGKKPRGMENNNPANLREVGIPWNGLVPGTPKGSFSKFKDMSSGIRAFVRNLISWKTKHNFDNLQQGITRFAPPTENDTAKYIAEVSKRMGIKPDQAVDFTDKPTMHKLVPAMLQQEVGDWYKQIDPAVISNAVESAFTGLKLPAKTK